MASTFFFLFLSSFFIAAQQTQFNISLGTSLTPTKNNFWFSPSGRYAFGFYQQANGYAVGIFLAGIPQKTVVWTAHRDDQPISGNATLQFTSNGSLILQSTQGRQTYISNTTTAAAYASMLDSGNFVLYSSDHETIWQSFEHPTDTLLPGQKLLTEVKLISSVSETDHSTGLFCLRMQSDGNLVQYPLENPFGKENAYWVSNAYGKFNVTLNLDDDGHLYLVDVTGSTIKNITDGYPFEKTIHRLKIDPDGILRLYSHNFHGNSNWSISWSSTNDSCDPKGRCGPNSYCVVNDQKADCQCIPGFELVNRANWSSGCESNFTTDGCTSKNGSIKYTFQELPNIEWRMDPYLVQSLPTKEDCEKTCSQECDCGAAQFKDGNCSKLQLPLRYGRILNDSSVYFIKLAQKDVEDHGLLVKILLPIAMVILSLGLVMCYLRRRVLKSREKESLSKLGDNDNSDAPNLQVFSFANVVAATNDFSIENKLGEGGYGPVYKGILPNGQEIAVKRLSKTSRQGLTEFKNEVMLTAKLQHVNLVRLVGYCTQREEKMLIYEYMSNKSLDFYLFDLDRQLLLDWNKRVQIIEGVTQGLLYLQEYSRLTILHRDLKASNILLDNEMKPKISNLGMARIFEKDEDETNERHFVGTYGYVPPECVKDGAYSMKSDVYSFGVLLLQIISGKKHGLYGLNEDLFLLEYAYELWKDGKGMEFMDPSLDDANSPCKLMTCMQVALLCVQEKPEDRLSMLEVSSMLKNDITTIAMPKRPAFSIKRGEDDSGLQYEGCSNDATITQTLPR